LKVLVWGLGYVGSVTAGCLAHLGYEVVGIEPNETKLARVNSGCSPVKEPELDSLVSRAIGERRLRAVRDGAPWVNSADVSFICVGTPSSADGRLMLDYVRKVAVDIGTGLRDGTKYHAVALRSTVLPGTVRNVLAKILEQTSGRKAGRDFGLVMNPEFMREASAVEDFFNPPYTVIGALDSRSGDVIEQLYNPIGSDCHRLSLEEAEILKLCNNAFHGLKVGFANEIGRLCKNLDIDSQTVMRLVCADRKLNISSAYLKPGFAFGGSCLPKDIRSLTSEARRVEVELPILESILPSNRLQIDAARRKVLQTGAQRVGVLGLSFKPQTDDLRESPMISLIRDLWQDGVDVLIHDPDVNPEEMLGSNLEYLERQLPQIHRILRSDLQEVLENSQVVIVGQKRAEFTSKLEELNREVIILDLVRVSTDPAFLKNRQYLGIAW
jgi:GDP-mannose 6-dehydrogenase